MSKETKKRTIVYSNVKQNKKKAEESKRKSEEHINLDDEIFIGLDESAKERKNKKKEKAKSKEKAKKAKKDNEKRNYDFSEELDFESKIIDEDFIGQAKNNKKEKNVKNVEKTKRKNVGYNSQEKNKERNQEIKTTERKQPIKQQPKKTIKKQTNNNQKKKQYENKPPKKAMNPKIKRKIIAIIRFIIIVSILVVGGLVFIKSSLFNIKEINVSIANNKVLTELHIKDLSQIQLESNIYSISKKNIIDNIKQDPYVEDVKIKRVLPSKLEISIIERVAKYQIEKDGQYIYIDSQGYILEHSSEKNDYLVLKGTKTSDLTSGNRLEKRDLDSLKTVEMVLREAETCDLKKMITAVDVEESNDCVIYLDGIGKSAHIGNTKSLNDKMAYVKKIIEKEDGIEGEIFVNVDLNKGEYPYFREKI